jgi:hypothetical protein
VRRDLIEGPDHRKKLPQTLEGFFFMDEENHTRRRTGGASVSSVCGLDPCLSTSTLASTS